ncbi:MAG: hypothetical protein ACFWUH_01145 [Limosilactobacillus fermentum]
MLLPGALMLGLMSPVTGRLFDRYGARFLSITGLTLLIIGTVPFLTLTKNTPLFQSWSSTPFGYLGSQWSSCR